MSGFHSKDLIREVKCRPGIYNRDLLEHPKREHKHQLWLEVGEKLTPQEDWDSYTDVEKDARVDEIQAKWKHIRDHFYRELKLASSSDASKKRKYVYFEEMEFMRPYVGFKLTGANKAKTESMDEDNISQYYMEENDTDEVMEELLKSTDTNEEERSDSPDLRRNPKRNVKPTQKVLSQKTSTAAAPPKFRKTPKDVIKNFDVLKKTSNVHPASSTTAGSSGAPVPSFKIRDGDISFCLSLVPTFRKLGDSAKLRAKIEMLKILHKYVESAERTKGPHANIRNSNIDVNQTGEEHDMQEDHLEELDETINVKHEENDDPLHGSSGNTKAWWT
ncbi:uncharacterized protein LOC106093223 [Stomoxys calcitrans]|uniref:uncharacterized protein LOC106093223 n=1 Tax=Stomoxys calcitrans TaxID=35570 RepID=UPI0027E342C7|nr:uncharacterized protein LOC106093223 [Stomoxys calcitrans]